MQIPTAQAIAPIQYSGLAIPYFLEWRGGGWFPDTHLVRLSDNFPENLIRTPTLCALQPLAVQELTSLDELLDWDFVADPDPALALGKLSVTLAYSTEQIDLGLEGKWD